MKQIAFLLCCLVSLVSAENMMFEARAGYFYPQSGVMRAVYDDGGLMPGGEFSVRVWEDLLAWVNFSPFWKDGSSEG